MPTPDVCWVNINEFRDTSDEDQPVAEELELVDLLEEPRQVELVILLPITFDQQFLHLIKYIHNKVSLYENRS